MGKLYEQIREYSGSGIYPFHMPGHKRKAVSGLPEEWFLRDITEIADFDDLHQPKGILEKIQEDAAELFGANHTYLLINGSTCGILSAVAASVSKGGRILMARNCHRSAYHAAMLRELHVHYIFPALFREPIIYGAVLPEQIKAALNEDPGIEAVLITSPTYEGIVSDIKAIAEIVHEHDKVLIVDEAHGPHFGFHKEFPDSAVHQDADLVIHSLHKTLPALTQTALLHVNGQRVSRERISMYLSVFQTSSPSYLLLSSIDGCLEFLKSHGEKELNKILGLRRSFEEKVSKTKHLYSFGREMKYDLRMKALDPGKIVIASSLKLRNGQGIADDWRQHFHLEMEMTGMDYLLAIVTVMDEEDGFERLAEAILQTDEEAEKILFSGGINEEAEKKLFSQGTNSEAAQRTDQGIDKRPEQVGAMPVLSMAQAAEMECERVPLLESEGRISAGFIAVYPPGSPLVVPGEAVTKDMITLIHSALDRGYHIQGIGNDRYINALCKEGEKNL